MKKIIMLFLFVFTFLLSVNPVDAQIRIGAILDAPNEIVDNAEKLEKLNIKLEELLPSDKYFKHQTNLLRRHYLRKRFVN